MNNKAPGDSNAVAEAVWKNIRDTRCSLKGQRSKTVEQEFHEGDTLVGWSFKFAVRSDGKTIDMDIRAPHHHKLRSNKDVERALHV